MEFHINNICDYDKITDLVETELFTKLDDIEIIDENHPFIHFVKGLTILFDDRIFQNILHGWYHKEIGTAKFLVRNPSETGNVIVNAWRIFIGFENADVYIYSRYCGQIYKSNEYETDKKYFYKKIIKELIDKISD